MLLSCWLQKEGLTGGKFAALIQRSPEAVRRYLVGDRIPDKGTMTAIAAATSGQVTPNDFFDLPAEYRPTDAAAA